MAKAHQPDAATTPAAPGPAGADADLTGRTLGDFRLLRRLGQGGMGQVYLAEQVSLKRRVAIKVLKPELAANPVSLQRFKQEAEAVARVNHANIVQVYAVGEEDGLHFMALEFVDGCDLREYLLRKGSPPVPLAVSIMRQGAAALQRAGELGLVHRDIKPENILLTRNAEVKITDFGLSRCFAADQPTLNLTQSGVTMGTPLYMSPEQVEGRPIDPRTDIYSFGVTCYHMLAGQPPFQGQTAFEVALKHVQATPEPLAEVRPDLPPALCAVVANMIAKRPEDRYQSAGDLLRDLDRIRDDVGGTASASSIPVMATAAPAGARRLPRWLWAAVAASVLLALAGGAALGWRTAPAAPEEPLAPEPLSPHQEREQFLVKAFEMYGNSTESNAQDLGLRHCVELGLFYLDEWRLDEADRFFSDLSRNPARPRPFHVLGRLGHAIVLADRDDARASVQAFLEVFEERQNFGPRFMINRNPRFVQAVARAIDRDAINYAAAKTPFPPSLEEMRRPQPLPMQRPGGGRPGRPADRRVGRA